MLIKFAHFRNIECLRCLETRRMEPSPNSFADPLVPAQPKLRRRVGRPKGSKGRVMHGPRVLGARHFAFVLGSLWGLDWAVSSLRSSSR